MWAELLRRYDIVDIASSAFLARRSRRLWLKVALAKRQRRFEPAIREDKP